MQGHRFIATVFLLTLVALGVALPLGTAGYALLGVLAVAVVVYAVLGERHLASIGSTSQRSALASTIARRALAATDDQRAGIASMEEDIRDAVQRLTGASAGQSARHALDALPWVLVMGLPQSGKSSMLASSAQPFAYATPSGGARGGRNCRWWITPQCAWIDTGGSYILGESALPEWLTLLRNLATLRPTQPLHAVVLTMAADSIPAARPEDVDAAAKRVRERLDEALGYLGIDVPVYLMVTRSDLLPGFQDFFSDLREAEAHPRLRRAAPDAGAALAAAHGRARPGRGACHELPVSSVVRGPAAQPAALRRDPLRVQRLPGPRERSRNLFLQRR
jgi:type VI secretion system protein ImpL